MKKKQKNTMEQNLSTENIENAVDLGSEVQSNMDINEQEVNQMQYDQSQYVQDAGQMQYDQNQYVQDAGQMQYDQSQYVQDAGQMQYDQSQYVQDASQMQYNQGQYAQEANQMQYDQSQYVQDASQMQYDQSQYVQDANQMQYVQNQEQMVWNGQQYVPVQNGENGKQKKSVFPTILTIFSILVIIASVLLVVINRRAKEISTDEKWFDNEVEVENKDIKVKSFENIDLSDSAISDKWEYGCDIYGEQKTSDDKYWYSINPKDGNKLYRFDKSTYASECLFDYDVAGINVIDNKVYCVVRDEGQDLSPGIYCIDLKTKEVESIVDDPGYSMIVVNDWIYYISSYDYALYRLHRSSHQIISLTDNMSLFGFTVKENTVYYYGRDKETDETSIVSMDVDGKNVKVLKEKPGYNHYHFGHNFIIYANSNNEIGTLDYSTGAEVKLCDAYVSGGLTENKDCIYYVDNSNKGKLSVFNKVINETRTYDIEYATDASFIGDLIEITYLENNEEMVTVNDLSTGNAVEFYK